MGQELATGYVSIVASTKGLGRDITREFSRAGDDAGGEFTKSMGGKAKSGISGIGSALGGALKLGLLGAAAGAGLAIGGALKDGIKGASDLEQSVGGVQAVFKNFSGQIENASKSAATNLGLTRNSYNELATTLGAGLKNKGIQDFAGQTQKLIGLGADMAAQFGGSTQEAVEAISSLMRGETDPIERYGVAINETAINAELAARGQDKLKGAALEQAKAQARVDLLFRQTADAQGAFGRESDTLAGKQQRAAAQWEDLKTKIGGAFLPVISDAMGFISSTALPALDSLGAAASNAWGQVQAGMAGGGDGGFFATLGGQLSQLPALFDQVGVAWGDFVSGFQGGDPNEGDNWVWRLGQDLGGMWSAITTQVVPAVMSLSQTIATQLQPVGVMLANLFTTVILPALSSLWSSIQTYVIPAFAGVIAKVQEVWTVVGPIIQQIVGTIVSKFQELSPQINSAMTQVGQIIGSVMNLISTVVGGVLAVIKWLWSMWGDNIMAIVRVVMNTVWGVIQGALNVIQGVIRTVMALITGDWSGAWEGIKQIFSGIWQAITSILGGAIDLIKQVLLMAWDFIKSVFSAGGSFLLGLWNGMWDGIKSAASAAMDWVKSGISTALDAIKGFFDANVKAIGMIWDGLKAAASAPVRFVIDTVINNGIIKGWNDLVNLLKLDGKLRVSPISAPGFDGGGWTGPGSKYQPAGIVHADEFVVSKDSRRSIERANPGLLDYMNRTGSMPGYAGGGRVHPVPGYPANMGRGYHGVDRGIDIPAPMGAPVVAMRDSTVTGTAKWGYSYGWHVRTSDGAIYAHMSDILVQVGQILKAGQQLGKVGNTGNSFGSHLHVTTYDGAAPVGAAQAGGAGFDPLAAVMGFVTDKLASPVRALIDKIPGAGVFVDVAKGLGTRMLDSAVEKIKALGGTAAVDTGSGPGLPPPGGAVERWRPIVLQALRMMGQPESYADLTLRRLNQESSGNPGIVNNWDINARNGTPSKGLMQVIDPTFRAYAMPGYNTNIFDPLSNILASMRYALARYGSLPSAYNRKGGYLNGTRWSGGGLRPLSEDGRPELVVGPGAHRLRAGSQVFNANETQQLMGGTNVTYSPIVQSDDKHERQMEDFLFHFAQEVRASA